VRAALNGQLTIDPALSLAEEKRRIDEGSQL
jgi:hypothetical protein